MKIPNQLIVICFGSLMIAFAINNFLIPNRIIEGGVIGISLLIEYLFHVKAGEAILLISLPIYFAAWRYRREIVFYNILGLVVTACLVYLMSFVPVLFTLAPLYSAIVGGLMIGAGIGVMLRHQISTDGFDLLAHLLSCGSKVNVGIIIFIIDLIVICSGFMMMSQREFLLSLIAVTGVGMMTILTTRQNKNAFGNDQRAVRRLQD